MRFPIMLALGGVALVGACGRTDNGDLVVKRPVDVQVKTKDETIHTPTIGTTKDTVNTPVVGTRKETVVVNKPVVGTKKTVVNRPVVKP